jgi:serine/threonine-protein kinase HipA
MTFPAANLLTVYLEQAERRKVGRLALYKRQILFEYDPDFLNHGIQISPFHLPLQPNILTCADRVFDGLHGVFNDSLPDGWGRLLVDRSVERHGMSRHELNLLDRLAYVGRGGMGALTYEPDRGTDEAANNKPIKLHQLAAESVKLLTGDTCDVFDQLLSLNGSSGGARPKIVAQVSSDKRKLIQSTSQLEPGYSHWIVKFPSSQDPSDAGPIEYAYSQMARAAGVEMAETHLFGTKKKAYFGAQRFDRQLNRRVHVHTIAGLLHSDHRCPSLDYDDILRAVSILTKNAVEVQKVYTLACFNVLAYNRDDHSKNFSLLLKEDNSWAFAPAYDLTFSYGPGGEQSTMVLGEGRAPGPAQLLNLAKQHGIRHAKRILDQVQSAVARWKEFARAAGVSAKSTSEIAKRLQSIQ